LLRGWAARVPPGGDSLPRQATRVGPIVIRASLFIRSERLQRAARQQAELAERQLPAGEQAANERTRSQHCAGYPLQRREVRRANRDEDERCNPRGGQRTHQGYGEGRYRYADDAVDGRPSPAARPVLYRGSGSRSL
jgi:hypothetical protein